MDNSFFHRVDNVVYHEGGKVQLTCQIIHESISEEISTPPVADNKTLLFQQVEQQLIMLPQSTAYIVMNYPSRLFIPWLEYNGCHDGVDLVTINWKLTFDTLLQQLNTVNKELDKLDNNYENTTLITPPTPPNNPQRSPKETLLTLKPQLFETLFQLERQLLLFHLTTQSHNPSWEDILLEIQHQVQVMAVRLPVVYVMFSIAEFVDCAALFGSLCDTLTLCFSTTPSSSSSVAVHSSINNKLNQEFSHLLENWLDQNLMSLKDFWMSCFSLGILRLEWDSHSPFMRNLNISPPMTMLIEQLYSIIGSLLETYVPFVISINNTNQQVASSCRISVLIVLIFIMKLLQTAISLILSSYWTILFSESHNLSRVRLTQWQYDISYCFYHVCILLTYIDRIVSEYEAIILPKENNETDERKKLLWSKCCLLEKQLSVGLYMLLQAYTIVTSKLTLDNATDIITEPTSLSTNAITFDDLKQYLLMFDHDEEGDVQDHHSILPTEHTSCLFRNSIDNLLHHVYWHQFVPPQESIVVAEDCIVFHSTLRPFASIIMLSEQQGLSEEELVLFKKEKQANLENDTMAKKAIIFHRVVNAKALSLKMLKSLEIHNSAFHPKEINAVFQTLFDEDLRAISCLPISYNQPYLQQLISKRYELLTVSYPVLTPEQIDIANKLRQLMLLQNNKQL